MTADHLKEKLQSAQVGSRELDAEIDALLFGGLSAKSFSRDTPGGSLRHSYSAGTVFLSDDPSNNGGHVLSSHHRQSATATTSLDAALALAERLNLNGPCDLHRTGVNEWGFHFSDMDTQYASTPALALCAAIIAAKEGT